jgi:hypothetical protein
MAGWIRRWLNRRTRLRADHARQIRLAIRLWHLHNCPGKPPCDCKQRIEEWRTDG